MRFDARAADTRWLRGFTKSIAGERLTYHSPQHDVTNSLLVRSLDRKRDIRWQTEAVPPKFHGSHATFVWMFGIDVNQDSHAFDLFVEDERILTFTNPRDTTTRVWRIRGKHGTELLFRAVMIDKYDDFMGYTFLTVPVDAFPVGRPLNIRIAGETAGSRSWYMTFMYSFDSKLSFRPEKALVRQDGRPFQLVRVEIVHFNEPERAVVRCGNLRHSTDLKLGYNALHVPVPAVKAEKTIEMEVVVGDSDPVRRTIRIEPVKPMTLYLLHHSHVDIGYTHVQDEVEKLHWSYYEQAVDLIANTADYPSEARFRWNVESMWAVTSYLRQATEEKRRRFIEAVQTGGIGLDGMVANMLTGLCRPEELMRLFDEGRRVSRLCGVPLEAAMIIDIPGYSWGIVPALARNGIKYFAIGTNTGHRIGTLLEAWADRPFYWVSPSGEERVLCWVAGKGYSWYHTGLGFTRLKKTLEQRPILDYVDELYERRYPFDMVIFHYNVGSDNGPPDPMLPDKIRAWNQKFVSPRLMISTTAAAFAAFEREYGTRLPVMRGDFTGYWEDGAASSALETALTRNAAERLIQAEVLWSIVDPVRFPVEGFQQAWRSIMLFNEHTWGSWNSVSEPESPFTLSQWRTKRSFALEADKRSRELLENATSGASSEPNPIAVDVYNTSSWQRTDLVRLAGEISQGFSGVLDDGGHPVPSQRLSAGEMVFLAKDIPALGARRFLLTKKRATQVNTLVITDSLLSNGSLTLGIDNVKGVIDKLVQEPSSRNLVNAVKFGGLNAYAYVRGRDPASPLTDSKVTCGVKEKGPLVASILIESEAPGCRHFSREIRLVKGIDRVEIINTVDKVSVIEQEGVYFAFPFEVPGGQIRLDCAWGHFRPEADQIPGACKNYFTAQRWADVSNQEMGITLSNTDAPLFEIGEITTDAISYGWIDRLEPSQTLISYPMNNYWETNYRAAQEGEVTFRYAIQVHGPFNAAGAERFGIEQSQPLIAVPADPDAAVRRSLFVIESAGVIASSIRPSRDGKALMIRLHQASGCPDTAMLEWCGFNPSAVFISGVTEERGRVVTGPVSMPAYGIRSIRAEF